MLSHEYKGFSCAKISNVGVSKRETVKVCCRRRCLVNHGPNRISMHVVVGMPYVDLYRVAGLFRRLKVFFAIKLESSGYQLGCIADRVTACQPA